VRVCKKDIPNFPTTQILPELYRIAEPSLMDKLYGEMEAELEKLAARRAEDVDPNHALTKILRLREQVEMLKIPIALELIYDAYEQGRSVVVFCNFRETVFALSRRMQHIPHGTLVGGMRPKDLRRTVDDFQDNQLRALATVSEVGGVGLGFHDLTGDFPRETLIFPGWSALSFEQLTGRVQRDGAKSHSIQRVLLADGTIENHVYRALSTKLSNQSALTDEDFVPWRVKYPAQQVEIALKEKIDAEDNALVESVSSQLDLSPTSGLEEDSEIPF
jgi:ERCC4-related helicase